MITLKDVSRKYKYEGGAISAVDDVSLRINKGDFVSLMGPSGSGKSTLLHLIGLLDRPDSGEIYFNNSSVLDKSDNDLANLRNEYLGFVFQNFYLLMKERVIANVLLPTSYSKNKVVSHDQARALLDRLGIGNRYNSFPNALSGGQQQRVAIARALIMDPEIILADEPTGNLDSKTGSEILDIFKELNSEGKTVIIVTHDIKIASYTDKNFHIKDGKLV